MCAKGRAQGLAHDWGVVRVRGRGRGQPPVPDPASHTGYAWPSLSTSQAMSALLCGTLLPLASLRVTAGCSSGKPEGSLSASPRHLPVAKGWGEEVLGTHRPRSPGVPLARAGLCLL